MTKPSNDEMEAAMHAICHGKADNAVAWHILHRAGLMVDVLREVSKNPSWEGPKPDFAKAPKPTSAIWKHLEAVQ